MPLPDFLSTSNTFRQWLATTNNLISYVDNTSVYILASQNATPRVTTGNVSVNGTITLGATTLNTTAYTGVANAATYLTAKLPLSNTSIHTVGNVTSITTGQDWFHYSWSAGLVSGATITDNGNGSVTIANGEVVLRSTDADHANLAVYFVPGTTLTLANNDINYIYADYNANTPIYTSTTDATSINGHTETLLYVLSRDRKSTRLNSSHRT